MSQNFNIEPYWDDFEAANGALENNYMRLLFRPGNAVQARELTQIQSILQNQLKQLGNHIFQDGSPVVGGHLSIDTSVNYVKLEKQFGGNDVDVDDFLNLTVFNNQSPKTRARVVQTYTGTTDRALMVKYIRGTEFSASETITSTTNQSANVVPVNFTGLGSTCTINDGVFYVEGFFVKVAEQTIVLDPYSTTPTYRVGLEIDEKIVTENEDTALLDPAQNSFNYQAPGAHRYKFNLVLAKRSIDSVDDERFFELLRVENGVVTKQVNYPIYSELEKTLARRTYDESGDYVVKPFRVNLSANTPAGATENTSTFIINVEPGKAYVKGFEFETIGTQKIHSTRARTFKESLNYNLSVYYGNRIQLSNYTGSASGVGFSQDIEEIDIHCVSNNAVTLNGNTHTYFSTKIGSAKIKNLDRAGTTDTYYVYLSDLEFSSIIGIVRQDSLYFNEIYLPNYFPAVAGAYKDAKITMLTGDNSGQTAIITGYNGTSKLALLNREFRSAIKQGDQFSLTMPFSAAESFIKTNAGFTGAVIQANVARTSKDAVDSAILEDTAFNKNIYELPNYYVRYDSDQNASLYRRLIRRAQFIANGTYTFGLSSPEEGSFDFGTNASVVSSADVNENIIVMPVEGANTGRILDMTTAGRSVYRSTAQQIIINTNGASGNTFYADVIVTTKLSDIENTKRVKTLRQANNEITAQDVPSTAASVVGRTDVKINLANGVAWFTSANVINRIPEVPQSLFVADVIKIKKVYDSGTLSAAPNVTNKIDITDRYTFSSGQNENYYDHASITLKPGAVPPTGQTAVFFDYYEHTGYGYLAAASYPLTVYDAEQIPIYKSDSGKIYNLRDCIDLRPIRNPGTTTNPYNAVTLSPTVNIAAGQVYITANTNRLYANNLTPPLLSGSLVRINNEERIVANVNSEVEYTLQAGGVGAFIPNETVYAGASFALASATGTVISFNAGTRKLRVRDVVGAVGSNVAFNGVSSGALWYSINDGNASAAYMLSVTNPFNTTATNTAIQLLVPNKKFGNVEVYVQRPTDPLELDFSYYLPRTDLLVLTKDKEFKVLTGVPAVSPIEPTVNEDAMPIYRIGVPAYTAALNSVNLEYIDNRRYTMKDIAEIDQRLKDVEELIALKEAEEEVINNPPKSPTTPNINKPIYGTLVDDFDDLSIADANKDFAAGIDNSRLTCYKNIVNLDLRMVASSDNDARFDKFESIGYTEIPAVQQKFATVGSEQKVQTAIIGKFEGFVTLTPESDYYFSTEHQPLITDVFGRFLELKLTPKADNPAITDSLVETIGAGNYNDVFYNTGVVLGTLNPIAGINNILLPSYNNNPTQFEPRTTVPAPVRFDGTAFSNYQGTNWTGFAPLSINSSTGFVNNWLDSGSAGRPYNDGINFNLV